MKNQYFQLLIGLFGLINVVAAQPELEWSKTYRGSNSDIGESIQQTTDGGYIVAGSTFSNDFDVNENNGVEDWWILKIDASGNIQWEKNLGGSSYEKAHEVKQTLDGGDRYDKSFAFDGE